MSDDDTSGRMLYVVMGTTGEYSDRSEWPVRSFLSLDKAQAFVLAADTWLRENGIYQGSDEGVGHELRPETCPFDPGFSTGYTGTGYYVMPVPLDDDTMLEIAVSVDQDLSPSRSRAVQVVGALGEKEEA